MDESREGPPFEPDNIEGPRSLLITNSDVEGVGSSTPYGAVLSWWQALQRGKVERVKRSYAGRVSRREAKREIDRLPTRFSQPIDGEVQTQGNRATVATFVRTATRLARRRSVVAIADYPTSFSLARRASGWRLRRDSFDRFIRSKRRVRRLARAR